MEIATITTADNMSEDTYRYICENFEKKLNKKFEFQRVIKNKIIGGFIADIDGKIYDLSLRTQFRKLQNHFDKP